jgi:hypothetical protein
VVEPVEKYFDGEDDDCSNYYTQITSSSIQLTCIFEYDVVLDESKYNQVNYDLFDVVQYTKIPQNLVYCPDATYDVNACTCKLQSDNMLYLRTAYDSNQYSQISCKKSPFADFARYSSTITTSNVNSASPDYYGVVRHTLEFWFFFNPYVGNTFNSFSLSWSQHSSISISYNSGMVATCTPFLGYTSYSSMVTNAIPLNPYNWNHLRCSIIVDTESISYKFRSVNTNNPPQTFYENVDDGDTDDSDEDDEEVESIPRVYTPTTTMVIQNSNVNLGVLFLRQIHLWNCTDCYDILQLKVINHLNQLFYPELLLHAWDPINAGYNITGNYTDIVTNSVNITLEINNVGLNPNWIGNYIIDDTQSLLSALLNEYNSFYPEISLTEDLLLQDSYEANNNNQYFYNAYVFSNNLPNPINDERNGIMINAYFDVNIFI